KRTKAEIKRDYEYLLRLWENIRENTLHSIAPALIYEEEDLVKRAIRDLYDKDIEGVFVEGEAGFKEARDFMRMLMPSQAKKVQAYRDPEPLFVKYKVEDHLSQIYSPVVPLRSGGYLVINQTEALVAVDVNSGKSTRERNIEATALKTNLEAAEETARQLRLRDLAGLIVIDFIDMDESKNNRAVEKKLKDALKDDRARIQMGKISGFGLMEISRQRRRTGVLEGTTHVCEHCNGTGRVRSVESSALATLRALEIEALKGGGEATLKAPRAVALYILNEKRAHLARIHETFGLFVTVVMDDAMPHADYEIERTASETRPDHAIPIPSARSRLEPIEDDGYDDSYEDEEDEDEEDEDEGPAPVRSASVADEDDEDEDEDREEASGEDDADGRTRGRGRRRRRRGGRRDEEERAPAPEADTRLEDENGGRRRRRGRRGGRRLREDRPGEAFAWVRPWVPYGEDPFVWFDLSEDPRMAVPEVTASAAASQAPAAESSAPAEQSAAPVARAPAQAASEDDIWVELPEPEDKPKRRRSRGKAKAPAAEAVEAAPEAAVEAPESVAEAEAPAVAAEETPAAEPAKPKRTRTRRKAEPKAEADAVADVIAEAAEESVPVAAQPAPQPEAQPEPQAVPEPVATPAPQPVEAVAMAEPAAPDPAEITAPPAKPRRGWWRRG
ncbi:MAG: ribonuclease E/G, partial [Alphaproteobacteria bacterium]|nr:ribonuclease E/G [Alphaproteobacteria bacterium]